MLLLANQVKKTKRKKEKSKEGKRNDNTKK